MADFCRECNLELFDLDEPDFGPYDPALELKSGEGFLVLCETCGPILVDHSGNKISEDFVPGASRGRFDDA